MIMNFSSLVNHFHLKICFRLLKWFFKFKQHLEIAFGEIFSLLMRNEVRLKFSQSYGVFFFYLLLRCITFLFCCVDRLRTGINHTFMDTFQKGLLKATFFCILVMQLAFHLVLFII